MNDDDDDRPIKPMSRLSQVSSSAARIAEIKKFRGTPELRRGLCPGCLDSGYVTVERKGLLGVLYRTVGKDKNGKDIDRLVRCGCRKESAQIEGREPRQLVGSVNEQD